MSARTELVWLAAEMARGTGLPSEFAEDHKFCKTTPAKDRSRLIKQAEQARETARVWAIRANAIADMIENG